MLSFKPVLNQQFPPHGSQSPGSPQFSSHVSLSPQLSQFLPFGSQPQRTAGISSNIYKYEFTSIGQAHP